MKKVLIFFSLFFPFVLTGQNIEKINTNDLDMGDPFLLNY